MAHRTGAPARARGLFRVVCLGLLFVACCVGVAAANQQDHWDADSVHPGGVHQGQGEYRYDAGYMSDWSADWAAPPGSGRPNQPKCIDIPANMSLCHGIGYNQMRLPNLLDHDTVREVTQQASSWVPLLGIRCHSDTKLFLCSLFSPVCLDRPIWPCRTLCNAVKTGCEGRMLKYGFPWPEMLRCDKFPLDNDLCIGLQHDDKPDDTVCAACNHPATFESIVDNYCSAEFVLRVEMKGSVISGLDLKMGAERKTKKLKKGSLRKQDLRPPYFYIEGGARCECQQVGEAGPAAGEKELHIVMGNKRDGKMYLQFVQKYVKSDKDMKRAMRAIRKGDICKDGLKGMTMDRRKGKRGGKHDQNQNEDQQVARNPNQQDNTAGNRDQVSPIRVQTTLQPPTTERRNGRKNNGRKNPGRSNGGRNTKRRCRKGEQPDDADCQRRKRDRGQRVRDGKDTTRRKNGRTRNAKRKNEMTVLM